MNAEPRQTKIEEILKERAKKLAQRKLQLDQRQLLIDVIVVARSGVHLALPMKCAREVRRVKITKIPGARSPVEGLFQVRGECHNLFDLHSFFFGQSQSLDHGDSSLAIITQHGERTLGLRIDEVIGPRTVYRDELHDEGGQKQLPFVSEVTRDILNIIDIGRLFDELDSNAA